MNLGVESTVLTTNANGKKRLELTLGQEIQVAGVNVYYYPIVQIPPRSYFYCPKLARACSLKIPKYDLVVLETLYTQAMGPAVAACLKANVPYIVSLRGQLLPWALRQKSWKKILYFALSGQDYKFSGKFTACMNAINFSSRGTTRGGAV